jgi:hypothetical protein
LSAIYGRPANLAFRHSAYVITRGNVKASVRADSEDPIATIAPTFLRSEITLRNCVDGSVGAVIKSYMRWLNAYYTILDAYGVTIGVLRQRISILGIPEISLAVGDDSVEFVWADDLGGCAMWWASIRRNDFDLLWQGKVVCRYRTRHTAFKRGVTVDFSDDDNFALDRRLGICVAYLLLTTRPQL